MAIHFCSFADKRFHKSLKRIRQQAIASHFFDGSIYCWDETNLDPCFHSQFAEFLTPFTFYLCAWKPQVVLQAFSKMQEGDILLYADVGCHINIYGRKRFNEYVRQISTPDNFLLVFQPDADMPESQWTNGDTFEYFNCRNNHFIKSSPQILATTFLIKKTASAEAFMNSWLKVFLDQPQIAYRSKSKSENFDDYIEHRSDQSFFSILAKKQTIIKISSYEVQGSSEWETDMKEFPIWAKRDKVIDEGFLIHPTPGRLILIAKRKLKKWLSGLNSGL